MENKDFIIEKFNAVKALNFVKSNRKNNTGIGKTFEDYVGVVENNADAPDLAGFEIKSHREESQSYVTLFTKSPTIPKRGANSYLRDKFGVPYEDNPNLKKLHTSMFASRYNTFKGLYSFRLLNDRESETLRIGVYTLDHELIDATAGYHYEAIDKILNKKLKNLFYVSAERKKEGEDELFYFNRAEIYTKPSFERFIQLVDDGKVMYDIRIGSYGSGQKLGKAHDHGSGFRLMEMNLRLLYDEKEIIC